MAYELYEGLDNAGDLLKALSAAARPDSDGGAKITFTEIGSIMASVGIKIVEDIADDEPEAE